MEVPCPMIRRVGVVLEGLRSYSPHELIYDDFMVVSPTALLPYFENFQQLAEHVKYECHSRESRGLGATSCCFASLIFCRWWTQDGKIRSSGFRLQCVLS